MKLTALTPMLRTWELQETIAFYTEILGFHCATFNEESGWAFLKKDDVTLMLSGPNSHEGDFAPSFTGSLYFNTDNVDAIWEQIKDRVETCYAPESFPYGMRELVRSGKILMVRGVQET